MASFKALGLVFLVVLGLVFFGVLLRGTLFSEAVAGGLVPVYALSVQLCLLGMGAFALVSVLPQFFWVERVLWVLVAWAVVYLAAVLLNGLFGEELLCVRLARDSSPEQWAELMQTPYLHRICVEGRIAAWTDITSIRIYSMQVLFVILASSSAMLAGMLGLRLCREQKRSIMLACAGVLLVGLLLMNTHFLLSIITVLQGLVKMTMDPLEIKLPHYGPLLGTVVPQTMMVFCVGFVAVNLAWLFVRLRLIFKEREQERAV